VPVHARVLSYGHPARGPSWQARPRHHRLPRLLVGDHLDGGRRCPRCQDHRKGLC
jgi:hypothetical protein